MTQFRVMAAAWVMAFALSSSGCDDTHYGTATVSDADDTQPTPYACQDLQPWDEPEDLPPAALIEESADWCRGALPGNVFARIPQAQFTDPALYRTDYPGRPLTCGLEPIAIGEGVHHPRVMPCASTAQSAAGLFPLYSRWPATFVAEQAGTFVFSLAVGQEEIPAVVLACPDGYALDNLSIWDSSYQAGYWIPRGQLQPGLSPEPLLELLHTAWFHSSSYLIAGGEPSQSGSWTVYPACAGHYEPGSGPNDDDLPVEVPAELHVHGGAIAYNRDSGAVYIGGLQVAILTVPEE